MTPEDLAELAQAAYQHMTPWTADQFVSALAQPETVLVTTPYAFALGRVVLDEAELLALATDPTQHRKGFGRAVLSDFHRAVAAQQASTVFLEVSVENAPACALYRAAGYDAVGRRPKYYRNSDGSTADALIMTKALA